MSSGSNGGRPGTFIVLRKEPERGGRYRIEGRAWEYVREKTKQPSSARCSVPLVPQGQKWWGILARKMHCTSYYSVKPFDENLIDVSHH